MKQIVFIFMAILLATGMASAQKKSVISAETTSFDFGTIKEADGKVSHTFEVSNTGDMPLVSEKSYTLAVFVIASKNVGGVSPFRFCPLLSI